MEISQISDDLNDHKNNDIGLLSDKVTLTIPRVVIEIFCITTAFASSIQTAVRDRRMSRAKVSIGMGGVGKALQRYGKLHTPHVVILESSNRGNDLFSELEQFSNVCDVNSKVIVAGNENDISTYRELIKRGITEYILTPANSTQIIETLCGIFSDPSSVPLARTIGFMGVKGGTGTSVICHNFSWMLAVGTLRETILVDLDIEFGIAALNFNLEASRTIIDAFTDVERLDDVKLRRLLYNYSEHFKLLASPAAFVDNVKIDHEAVLSVLEVIKQSSEIAVYDIPHSWGEITKGAILDSDDLVLVATPDLASLRNMKTIYERLVEHRINDRPPKIILNQTGVVKRPEIPVKDFVDIVGAPVDLVLPYDPELFGRAMNDGEMLAEVSSSHSIVQGIRQFAQTFYKFSNTALADTKHEKQTLVSKIFGNIKNK